MEAAIVLLAGAVLVLATAVVWLIIDIRNRRH